MISLAVHPDTEDKGHGYWKGGKWCQSAATKKSNRAAIRNARPYPGNMEKVPYYSATHLLHFSSCLWDLTEHGEREKSFSPANRRYYNEGLKRTKGKRTEDPSPVRSNIIMRLTLPTHTVPSD
jgi:hypothetical protein